MAYELKDYNEVVDRVRAFNEKYPTGSLQSEITHLTDKLVIVKAYAYRNPEDQKPSIAHSQLGIPGTTNFTRGSEVENAETSAVGRALAFLGFAAKKSLASSDEVANKKAPAKPAAKAPADNPADLPFNDPPAEAPLNRERQSQKEWMKAANAAAKAAGSSIKQTLKLGDQTNLIIELGNWQSGNGYTDDEALEEFKKLIPQKAEA